MDYGPEVRAEFFGDRTARCNRQSGSCTLEVDTTITSFSWILLLKFFFIINPKP